jgi:hypothetical protein
MWMRKRKERSRCGFFEGRYFYFSVALVGAWEPRHVTLFIFRMGSPSGRLIVKNALISVWWAIQGYIAQFRRLRSAFPLPNRYLVTN